MKGFIVLIALHACLLSFSQEKKSADAILGTWLTGEGNGIVEIYKNGEKFQGRIVWLKEPNDPGLANPELMLNILTKHSIAVQYWDW